VYFKREEVLKFYKVAENDRYDVIKLIDKIEKASRDYTVESTGFVNPLLKKICVELLKSRDLNLDYLICGGYDEAEYCEIIIYPDYIPKESIDKSISILAIKLNKFIANISHRDVLGSLMGLGIKRDQIGDIKIYEDEILVICTRDIEEFLLMNFNKIGNKKIKCEKGIWDRLSDGNNGDGKSKNITVSSLRLDSIISNGFNTSRKIAAELIKKERVKHNFIVSSSPNVVIDENDIISVRGYGRIKVVKINGKTRKDRISITISIFS
jgi:RNA-binding protein YlmH